MRTNAEPSDSRRGAVVLCGGGSRRMGLDKANLPFGEETMLGRIVRLVAMVVPAENVVVVAACDQQVPTLPANVRVVRDEVEAQGPLAALVAGLESFGDEVDAAFVTACDTPLLTAAFIERMLEIFDERRTRRYCDGIVPADSERIYPLAAVLSPRTVGALRLAFDEGRRSLYGALESGTLSIEPIDVEWLRSVDRRLDSLVNCNTPEEYRVALFTASRAGK